MEPFIKYFIPSVFTRYLQPLDLVINKPFKEGIKKIIFEWCLDSGIEWIKVVEIKL